MKYRRVVALLSALMLLVVGAGVANADQVRADGDALAAGLQEGNPATVALAPGGTHTFRVAAHIFEQGNSHVEFPVGIAVTKDASFLGTPSPTSGNITGYGSAGQLAVAVIATAPASEDLTCGITNTLSGKVDFTATSDQGALGTQGTNAQVVLKIAVAGPACPDDSASDTTAPTIEWLSDSSTATSFGWWKNDVTVTWTCSDDTDGSWTETDTTEGEGADLEASATCTDEAGNSSSDTRYYDVDKTAPTASLTGVTNGTTYTFGGVPTPGCDSSDNEGGSGLDAASVLTTGGTQWNATASCSAATDRAGNSSSAPSASYSVRYATGDCLGSPGRQILQPVDKDGSSVFKLGSTVPAKFRVCDADGASVGNAGVVASFRLTNTVSGLSNLTVDEPVIATTPDTAFRWSGDGQQWIYNINTKGLASGTKYTYTITLNDTSTITFAFALKK